MYKFLQNSSFETYTVSIYFTIHLFEKNLHQQYKMIDALNIFKIIFYYSEKDHYLGNLFLKAS